NRRFGEQLLSHVGARCQLRALHAGAGAMNGAQRHSIHVASEACDHPTKLSASACASTPSTAERGADSMVRAPFGWATSLLVRSISAPLAAARAAAAPGSPPRPPSRRSTAAAPLEVVATPGIPLCPQAAECRDRLPDTGTCPCPPESGDR